MVNGTELEIPTRRDYLKYGGTLIGGCLLAGCAGNNSSESPSTTNKTVMATDSDTENTDETAAGSSYSVTMEPVGSVTFDDVPETWFSFTGDYADMGVALGQSDGLSAIGHRARFGSHVYEAIPGVSVDKSKLTQLWQDGTGKEVFYELDVDIHLIDPNFMVNRLQWNQDDVTEIRDTVAPFIGNTIFSRVYNWHDYADYTMYEAFEKVAQVFQEQARYEAFKQYHDEVLTDVEKRLPNEQPNIAVLYPAEVPPESFYPYRIGKGTQSKHWNELNVRDALAQNDITDAQAGGATIDYETLLELDPDILAIRLQGEITQKYIDEKIVPHLQNHEIASKLRAVQNDRVIYGGLTYQGPIIHLFQLEQAAQRLYPDVFGGNQLFDRQRVADIITEGS
ncbi:ABC transporter substrate-binding protein [Halocatena marina]|uniref:ABC transporter substrate-binding protein n=1 Tax=Halocatena marina TaxID=2934937 RepID=A0ABD5YHZ8_9EURY|nr:ABC transporter substrate-binding protein [Halocatena marina]